MLKYTPPWQVLFHSLEQNRKTQTNSPQDVQNQRKRRIVSHSCQTSPLQDPVPAEDHRLSRITMANIPKRWVMKPLTPKLEKSDLRTLLSPGSEPYSLENSWSFTQNGDSHSFATENISVTKSSVLVTNGEDFADVVHAKQVAVSENSSTSEDWQPSTPNSPSSINSTDSYVGFYSFVDDPTSSEAEKNEIYMISPQRQAKLSTLKEKSRFKLQTYMEEKRPEKLFQETNDDCQYCAGSTSGEGFDEDKPDRMEIIRSQAPRKNAVFKEQWSALENLDLTNSPQHLVEGFSLCYSYKSTKPLQSEAEPGTIDNQQIDFKAARKQFQMMENTKQSPFLNNPQPVNSSPKLRGRSLSAGAKVFTKDVSKTELLKENSWKREKDETLPIKEGSENRSETSLKDYVEFGLVNHSVGSTIVESLSTEPSVFDGTSLATMSETPIEREIRISQEREQDLRCSRGIFLPDTSEMVEIKTKSILSLPTPQIKPIKAKEPNRMSLLFLCGMEKVNQYPGFFDRGNLHNENGRKRNFGSLSDQLDTKSSSTSPSIHFTGRSTFTKDTSIAENPVNVEQRDVLDFEESVSPCCPHRHPDETIWRESIAKIPNRTYTNEWTEKENNKTKTANQPFWMADYKPKESWTFAETHHHSLPPEPVKSSRSREVWRSLSENSSEWPSMVNAPDLIRREIEENLRREQELQELRETSNLSGTSGEPTLPSFITSNEVFGQRNNDQTPVNSSYDSLMEVDTVLPHKSIQKTSYSSSYSWNVDPTPVTGTAVTGPQSTLPSIMTAQPWSAPKHSTPAVHKAVPTLPPSPLTETSPHKGLTKTLLDDFKERRVKLMLEESAYAGIQLVDDINNEVVEVTRVTRQKNTRALRWEAGVYANEENN